MLSIHEVKTWWYWVFDYNPNEVYRLIRWEKEDNEDIPIVQRQSAYWTDEQEWKLTNGGEERCNPCATVRRVFVDFSLNAPSNPRQNLAEAE